MDQQNNKIVLLKSNKKYFEQSIWVAEKLFKEKLYEDCINYIEKTAYFGWFNFSGYYKSERLETLLLQIQIVILPTNIVEKKNKKNNVLHICSEISISGGHSKLIYNWIKNDNSKTHTVLSTRQSVEEIRDISNFYISDKLNIEHLSVKSSSKIESAKLLHNELLKNYDIIILHIHPDETLTNIVLSSASIVTPVYFVNHADHAFWLGTSISDFILQIRESNITLDAVRRDININRQFFLPIPVENNFKNDEILEGDCAGNNFINLLSTGNAYKYKPTKNYNFLQEAYRIVNENENVIFNVVGISPSSFYGQKFNHKRLILYGNISILALEEIEKKTDIYIEGFPVPSFTALLQLGFRKKPFALHYKPLTLFKLFSDSLNHGIYYPDSLEEWHYNIKKLISNLDYREEIAEKQYTYISNNFSIKVWKILVEKLYNNSKNVSHSVWKLSSDIFYSGENEKILVKMDNRKISHYSNTENLSLLRKYFVYRMSKERNDNVEYYGRKNIIKYLFSTKKS